MEKKKNENKLPFISYFCDFCESEFGAFMHDHITQCDLCKRDICYAKCAHLQPITEYDNSDNLKYYCPDCWKLGAEKAEEIRKKQEELEQLVDEWYEAMMEQAKS